MFQCTTKSHIFAGRDLNIDYAINLKDAIIMYFKVKDGLLL